MQSPDAVVTEAILSQLRKRIDAGAMEDFFFHREPLLFDWVTDELERLVGRLGMAGARPHVLRLVAEEVRELVSGVYKALEAGHHVVWEEEHLLVDEEGGLPAMRRAEVRSRGMNRAEPGVAE